MPHSDRQTNMCSFSRATSQTECHQSHDSIWPRRNRRVLRITHLPTLSLPTSKTRPVEVDKITKLVHATIQILRAITHTSFLRSLKRRKLLGLCWNSVWMMEPCTAFVMPNSVYVFFLNCKLSTKMTINTIYMNKFTILKELPLMIATISSSAFISVGTEGALFFFWYSFASFPVTFGSSSDGTSASSSGESSKQSHTKCARVCALEKAKKSVVTRTQRATYRHHATTSICALALLPHPPLSQV